MILLSLRQLPLNLYNLLIIQMIKLYLCFLQSFQYYFLQLNIFHIFLPINNHYFLKLSLLNLQVK